MNPPRPGRYTSTYDGDFVVFLIGMRINKVRAIREWVPVLRAARAMVAEARALPDTPLLSSHAMICTDDPRTQLFVQHWRSFDELEGWANNRQLRHQPAQAAFFRRTAYNGNVGIWHEAYLIRDGGYETIYANMPKISLAVAGAYAPLAETSTARDRIEENQT